MGELTVPADWWGVVWPCLLVLGLLVAWEVGRRIQARRKKAASTRR